MGHRFAVDTGGTFTDLALEAPDGTIRTFKAPTTPADPVDGVLDVLGRAAARLGVAREQLLTGGELIFATTRALNAVLTGTAARTAFLATEGHTDVLLLREGGRANAFDFSREYPEPYVPRRLTFGVAERIGGDGGVVRPLDEARLAETLDALVAAEVEAVAICLLWSIANPAHELRVAELIRERLPGVALTLSHELNPVLGEYARASSTAIDASLKPLMTAHLQRLEAALREAGLTGPVYVVTSGGGLRHAADVADAPIHAINSGPSMAPVAGRRFALDATAAIVADTGGTSYDISVVRDGAIPRTRRSWLGEPYSGHLTGFPSVDVQSIGAGGGSVAWVDEGGLLRVGPHSAGARPGPACYGHGGERPTVTDAALVLGMVDAERFLGGAMRLDKAAARRVLRADVADSLGGIAEDAAEAVLTLATEHMARAIDEVAIRQGIDPREAILIGGGGAAGLNSVAIARRLGCRRVVFPDVGAVLSAAGALQSDLTFEASRTLRMSSDRFDVAVADALLDELRARCEAFLDDVGAAPDRRAVELWIEARYPSQAWDVELPLPDDRLGEPGALTRLVEAFHATHDRIFAVRDSRSPVEVTTWHARATCRLADEGTRTVALDVSAGARPRTRSVRFLAAGVHEAAVHELATLAPGARVAGPAVVETPTTTVVLDPGASAIRERDALVVDVQAEGRRTATDLAARSAA